MTDKKQAPKNKQLSNSELNNLSGGTINKDRPNVGGCGANANNP